MFQKYKRQETLSDFRKSFNAETQNQQTSNQVMTNLKAINQDICDLLKTQNIPNQMMDEHHTNVQMNKNSKQLTIKIREILQSTPKIAQ